MDMDVWMMNSGTRLRITGEPQGHAVKRCRNGVVGLQTCQDGRHCECALDLAAPLDVSFSCKDFFRVCMCILPLTRSKPIKDSTTSGQCQRLCVGTSVNQAKCGLQPRVGRHRVNALHPTVRVTTGPVLSFSCNQRQLSNWFNNHAAIAQVARINFYFVQIPYSPETSLPVVVPRPWDWPPQRDPVRKRHDRMARHMAAGVRQWWPGKSTGRAVYQRGGHRH